VHRALDWPGGLGFIAGPRGKAMRLFFFCFGYIEFAEFGYIEFWILSLSENVLTSLKEVV
jgi:hypothetical protein